MNNNSGNNNNDDARLATIMIATRVVSKNNCIHATNRIQTITFLHALNDPPDTKLDAWMLGCLSNVRLHGAQRCVRWTGEGLRISGWGSDGWRRQ